MQYFSGPDIPAWCFLHGGPEPTEGGLDLGGGGGVGGLRHRTVFSLDGSYLSFSFLEDGT
jgi:hypothetical protein